MELAVHHDKILNTFNKHIGHERDRASEAGADREEYGKMLELCGLNKKATGWMKALHKMEADKRDDVLRSFDALRVEMEKAWGGQKTPDMFTEDLPVAATNDDDFFNDMAEPAPDLPQDFTEEVNDFEAALAGVDQA